MQEDLLYENIYDVDLQKIYDHICAEDIWNVVFQAVKNSASVKMINEECSVGREVENRFKNKFREIVPYNHNRIVLPPLDFTDSNYINASLVNVNDRSYIVTQYPYKTVSIFWSMVWNQRTPLIILLGKYDSVEEESYYPKDDQNVVVVMAEDKSTKYFTITTISKSDFDGFYLRVFRVFNHKTNENREISHIDYWSWPDQSVPRCMDSFLTALGHARLIIQMQQQRQQQQQQQQQPTEKGDVNGIQTMMPVVHCSAGAGRSGTFCLVDLAMDLMEKSESLKGINLLSLTKQLRCQRLGLVHSPKQLKFAFEAILTAYKRLLNADSRVIDSTYLYCSDSDHDCVNNKYEDNELFDNDDANEQVVYLDIDEGEYQNSLHLDSSDDIMGNVTNGEEIDEHVPYHHSVSVPVFSQYHQMQQQQQQHFAKNLSWNSLAYSSRQNLLEERWKKNTSRIFELESHLQKNKMRRRRFPKVIRDRSASWISVRNIVIFTGALITIGVAIWYQRSDTESSLSTG